MVKLYSKEELELDVNTKLSMDDKIEDVSINDVSEVLEEYKYDLKTATEGFKRSSNELFILDNIKTSIESKTLGSVEYFISIENYSLYLKSISNNLGIDTKIPSMEDFKNPYGTIASHGIVMEGFKDFIKSIWEKIKSFFKAFFKKIILFFKRLGNMDLQLDEYEEYIDDMIDNVKKSKKDRVDNITIESKLPKLLAEPGMDKVTSDFIFNIGERKLNNLVNVNNSFKEGLHKLLQELDSLNKEIEDIIKNSKTKDLNDLKSDISNKRKEYINILTKNIFKVSIDYNMLPEKVEEDVIYSFGGEKIYKDEMIVASLVDTSDVRNLLPKDFNIYMVSAEYNVTDDLRNHKIVISSDKERDIYVKNTITTIGNADNLIKFYNFYKKFSRGFNVKSLSSITNSAQDKIDHMVKGLEGSFKAALESNDNDAIVPATQMLDFGPNKHPKKEGHDDSFGNQNTEIDDETKKLIDENLNSLDNPADGSPGNNTDKTSDNTTDIDKDRKKVINELQKFLFSYLNSLQTLISDISINTVGTYQECKYELIKYIYKSASQF